MDVSVIVCTYNRCQLLRGNLEALQLQEVSPGLAWEVIVVDNNCTDDTAAVVAEAQRAFPVGLRRTPEPKQGLSNARNRGISEAHGTYLLFTDDDVRPAADWLQRMYAAFRESSAEAVGGRVDILWPIARPAWFADELVSSLAGVDYGPDRIRLTSERPPLGANMGFARRVFEAVGNFDPELGRIGAKLIGGEETDLFRRIEAAGMTGVYEPSAIVKHLVEPERLKKSYFRKLYYLGGQTSSRSFSAPTAKQIRGVPLYMLGQLLRHVGACVRERASGDPAQSFVRQLRAWHLLGLMAGCSSAQGRQRRLRNA